MYRGNHFYHTEHLYLLDQKGYGTKIPPPPGKLNAGRRLMVSEDM